MDTVVALMILSSAFVLSFAAMRTAHEVAVRGEEVRQAELLLRGLLVSGTRSLVPAAGASGDFSWTLTTQPTPVTRPVEICQRTASAHSVASQRAYQIATLEPCPTADPA